MIYPLCDLLDLLYSHERERLSAPMEQLYLKNLTQHTRDGKPLCHEPLA